MCHFSSLNTEKWHLGPLRGFAGWKTEKHRPGLSDSTLLSDPTGIPSHAGRYPTLIQLFPPNGSYSQIFKKGLNYDIEAAAWASEEFYLLPFRDILTVPKFEYLQILLKGWRKDFI